MTDYRLPISNSFMSSFLFKSSPIPYHTLLGVMILCLIPFGLEVLGFDFSTIRPLVSLQDLAKQSPTQMLDSMHYSLAGSFVHSLLEWSAFCTALFTAILAFVHFTFNRDIVTPIIGIALFYAGCMDGFHTLAADRLIEGVASSETLIPFTWAMCRLFSAVIMIAGASIFLIRKPIKICSSLSFIAVAAVLSGIIAYSTILMCVRSNNLPITLFPDSIITRPWDVLPLVLFAGAGFFVFPQLCYRHPSLFSQALLVSTVPQVITQIHMAFGSSELFDSNFNVAHFLKIVAYLVPFVGLCCSYIQINREKTQTVTELEKTKKSLLNQTEALAQTNYSLQTSELLLREQKDELEEALKKLQNTQFQLVQTEKMSSLGQLVAGVAHEINNPVNFIYGNLIHADEYTKNILQIMDLYQLYYPHPAPEIRETMDDLDVEFVLEDFPKLMASMQMGAKRIKEIVLALRNFSRMDEAELKSVNIHDGLDSTLTILYNQMKEKPECQAIEVIKNYQNLPDVECYAGQLNQVFMNLISNAIDALEPLREKEQSPPSTPTLWIETEHIDSQIYIRIRDNGSGIPEEIKHRLFDPFFTTKGIGKGTGLGLSISYQIIVERHQGNLSCSSDCTRGTEFVIQIPVYQG